MAPQFTNQYPLFAEQQKSFGQKIKELFQPQIVSPAPGYNPAGRSLGQKAKDIVASTWANLKDWNAKGSNFEMKSPLASGSVFKEYTPPKKVLDIESATKPTATPTDVFANTPIKNQPTPIFTGVARPGVGTPVTDITTYKGLVQRLPDATIDPIIKTVAQNVAMRPELIAAMLWQESGYRPDARNGNAKKGIDRGIAQINSKHHPEVTDVQADNPTFAIDWLGKEFQKSLTRYGGDINRAIAAHNRGPTGATWTGDTPSGLDQGGQDYVDKVAMNLTPELRKELGIKTTYDSL